ncbi:MAG: hypothetical protein AB7G80_05125 [Dongiaceae bacterium]
MTALPINTPSSPFPLLPSGARQIFDLPRLLAANCGPLTLLHRVWRISAYVKAQPQAITPEQAEILSFCQERVFHAVRDQVSSDPLLIKLNHTLQLLLLKVGLNMPAQEMPLPLLKRLGSVYLGIKELSAEYQDKTYTHSQYGALGWMRKIDYTLEAIFQRAPREKLAPLVKGLIHNAMENASLKRGANSKSREWQSANMALIALLVNTRPELAAYAYKTGGAVFLMLAEDTTEDNFNNRLPTRAMKALPGHLKAAQAAQIAALYNGRGPRSQ